MNSSDNDEKAPVIDFGSILAEARKSNNYTIEDICGQLKIPEQAIIAIENNDINALPAPTYTQGYIRAYAKFLEIQEDSVLEIYNRAVPHDTFATLKPRSNLPGEASSQSPLVKFVTMLLIFSSIAAVIYGSYQYYQEKAGVMETELESREQTFTGNSLDSPGLPGDDFRQKTVRLDEEDQLASTVNDNSQDQAGDMDDTVFAQQPAVEPEPAKIVNETVAEKPAEATVKAATDNTAAANATTSTDNRTETRPQQDTLVIYAKKGSWVKINDAKKKRLFNNLIPAGASKTIVGQAPFRATIGNARSTSMTINGQEIDLSKLIRAKNTAVFSVSTKNNRVIFH